MAIQEISKYPDNDSTWIYLSDWILTCIIGWFLLFFFDRYVGLLISWLFKLVLWRMYKIRVTVESFKISFLAGRVFAKNVTYVDADKSISVLSLNITWRYWLFHRMRLSEYVLREKVSEEPKSKQDNDSLPTRFLVMIDGLEVFWMNRTFAYDDIESKLSEAGIRFSNSFQTSSEMEKRSSDSSIHSRQKQPARTTLVEKDEPDPTNPPNSWSTEAYIHILLKVVPLGIHIKRGAIVIGNPTVPTVMCLTYKSAQGIYDLAMAANPLDPYRMVQNFNFDKFQVSLKPNINFDGKQYAAEKTTTRKHQGNLYVTQFQRAVHSIDKIWMKIWRKSKKQSVQETEDPVKEWRGLRRYLDGTDDVYVINDEEYAKVSMIVDATNARISYFWDQGGHQSGNRVQDDPMPVQGVEIELSGAMIQYGAWADKQRIPLQHMFVPVLARDSPPVPIDWSRGSPRQSPGFNISFQVKDELVLRIPTREPSKDKEQLHRTNPLPTHNEVRPFGWLELKMGPESNLGSYTSFVSHGDGFPHKLDGFFNKLEVRSSVNHDILLLADTHELSASIGFPLEWNGPCDWSFANVSSGVRLYLLREHVTLIADIFSDFASGDPTPYEFLRPFTYGFAWKLVDYKLFFNVNDHNIISNPLDTENNTYLSFKGEELTADISAPLQGPLTKSTTISYRLFTPGFDLELHTPPWHTTSAFMKESSRVGRSGDFTVDGSYTFYDIIEVNCSNYIEIRCVADDIAVMFYGFVVKYFFIIRENYFGEFVHFKTFEEYLTESGDDVLAQQAADSEPQTIEDVDYWKIPKTDNDVDVFFTFQVKRGTIIFPVHLYSSAHHISLGFESLDVDIRFTNYYMDLQADFSPVEGRQVGMAFESFDRYYAHVKNRPTQCTIDGLSIHAHRMFGIPPQEITYNAKWDFEAGKIDIDSSTQFVRSLTDAVEYFAFGFTDSENTLGIPEPAVYDAFNITFRCPVISVKLNTAVGVLHVEMFRLLVSFNDYPNNRYSGKVTVLVPEIVVEVLQGEMVVAALETSVIFNNFIIKRNGDRRWLLQEQHIQKNDAPFHRNPFLLAPHLRNHLYAAAQGCFLTSLTLPDANFPLKNDLANDSSGSLSDPSVISDESSQYGFNTMYPTQDYEEEDFLPATAVDPEFEYDNLVVEIGELKGFVGSSALLVVAAIAESWVTVTLETLIDKLQTKVVQMIKLKMGEQKAVVSARIVVPRAQITVGEYAVANRGVVWQQPPGPGISIDVHELSMAVGSRKDKASGDPVLDALTECTLAAHLKQVDIRMFSEASNPALLKLKDVEFWGSKSTHLDAVASLGVEQLSFDLDTLSMEWLKHYVDDMEMAIQPVTEAFGRVCQKSSQIYAKLVYILTRASTKSEIDHDPGVLTKPAYVLRSRSEHVRFYDGWKVTTRLRHILDSLPVEWRYQPDTLSSPLPDDAYDFVYDVFTRWRGWEAMDEQRKIYFDYIFGREHQSPSQGWAMESKLTSLVVRLHKGEEYDYVAGEKFTVSVRQQQLVKVPINNFGIEVLDKGESYEVVTNIGGIKVKATPVFFEMIRNRQQWLPNPKKPKVTEEKQAESIDILLSAVISVDYDISIHLPNTSIDIGGVVATDIELLALKLSSTPLVGSCALAGSMVMSVINDDQMLFNTSADGFDLVTGICEDAVKVIGGSMDKWYIKFGNKNMVSSLRLIKKDVEYINQVIGVKEDGNDDGGNQNDENITTPVDLAALVEKAGVISMDIAVSELTLELANEPLKVIWQLQGFEIGGLSLSDLIRLKVMLNDSKSLVKLGHVSVLQTETSGMAFAATTMPMGSNLANWLVDVQSSVHHFSADVPQLVNAVKAAIYHEANLRKKVDELILFVNDGKRGGGDTKKDTENDSEHEEQPHSKSAKAITMPRFRWSFSMAMVTLSTRVNDIKLALELYEPKAMLSNITHEGNVVSVPTYGDFDIHSARLVLLNRAVNVNQSTLVDVNINLSVFNNDDLTQSFQVKSQWCRVCLTPASFTRIVTCVDVTQSVWSTRKSPTATNFTRSPTKPESSPHRSIFDRFSSVQFLAYNFCVGWLFNTTRKDYPGVTFGAERFFATLDRKMGKLTLLDAYTSVANGNRSTNFYSNGSEITSLNRAFLPKMQVIYSIDIEQQDMRVMVNGDSVDVKFLSNSIVLLELSLESWSDVERFFSSRKKRMSSTAIEFDKANVSTFKPMFNQVEVSFHFDGSKLLFYRIEDCSPDSPGSLYLTSPAVDVAILYQHQGVPEHVLKLDVLISSSDNILHSSCVPVIDDIINGVRRMMRKSKRDAISSPSTPTNQVSEQFGSPPSRLDRHPPPPPSPASNNGLQKLFSQLDLHLGIRINPQQLMLSCEPTAKVAAVVAMQGIHVQINSATNTDENMLFGSLLVEGLSASLQHIYSREISGRVALSSITMLSSLNLGDEVSMLSSMAINDVHCYTNMKQIQDVELFKDIWFPKEFDDDTSAKSVDWGLAATEKISDRFNEVSTTWAFPWVLTFIITAFKLEVEFGPKLGNFLLDINHAWAVSCKSIDWSQDLMIGIDSIVLGSKGRLGVDVQLTNLNVHTAISWHFEDNVVEVPLILISAGFDHIWAKFAFDEHVFAMSMIEQFSVDIYNQKSAMTISKDHLSVQIACGCAEVYMTTLTASSCMDIYNTVQRMMQEKRTSYNETLKDSAKGGPEMKSESQMDSAILESVKKLESRIQLLFGHLTIYVFPSSFEDTKVLVVKLDKSRAQFSQNEFSGGISNELELKFNDLTIALSKIPATSSEFIAECSVVDFSHHAHLARGGNIFVFPSFKVSMRSFQKYAENVVDYLYQSSFGSTVDIRWNLGQINFIREMYSIHKRALDSRRSLSTFEPRPDQKLDEVIDDTINKVASNGKYQYVPMAPPIIEAPKLKELGNATPPLEWFGLHRNNFPDVTHQVAIVGLQRVIHEVVMQYSKILGKA